MLYLGYIRGLSRAAFPLILLAVAAVQSTVLNRVGARLRELRHERRLTQEALAERSGLSYKFIGEVERGIGNPTLLTLDALARALTVDLIDFFQSANVMLPPSAHDVVLAREALQSLDTFIKRAAPNPDVKYKLRRRKPKPRT